MAHTAILVHFNTGLASMQLPAIFRNRPGRAFLSLRATLLPSAPPRDRTNTRPRPITTSVTSVNWLVSADASSDKRPGRPFLATG